MLLAYWVFSEVVPGVTLVLRKGLLIVGGLNLHLSLRGFQDRDYFWPATEERRPLHWGRWLFLRWWRFTCLDCARVRVLAEMITCSTFILSTFTLLWAEH